MSTNLNKVINVQGHRGCRGLMPENTIEAFEKAIDLGVHTLEMDVVISKDKIVVVSHEPFMSKTYCLNLEGNQIREIMDKQYNLYKMTFDSLQLFDCGSKKHPRFPEQKNFKTHKPALGDVLKKAMFRNPIIKFNIELKARPKWDNKYTPEPKEFVALVLKVIEENEVFHQTNLQSFDLRVLEEIKRQSPKMKVALLVDAGEAVLGKMTKMSYVPEIISPYFKLLDAKTVKNLQAENFKIIPWTVNEVEDLQQMIDFGVDGIITDYPDRLIELLN